MKTIPELNKYINDNIQGVFGEGEMEVLKREIEKLQPGAIYVEIGVDEGKSARVAHEYAHPDVFKIFIDIHDPTPRGPWMEKEGMVGINKRGFYIHGDADLFANLFLMEIDLLFIDGHHDYESVKRNTEMWEPLVKNYGGVILFHDYDHPETKKWLDEHYGKKIEVFYDKIVKVIPYEN